MERTYQQKFVDKWRMVLCIFTITLVLFVPGILLAGQYKVHRVIDGDTLVVQKVATKMTIRLVGIDAPETPFKKYGPGQPFSQTSTKHLAGLVLNRSIEIKPYVKDKYGRTLAEVFLEGRNINVEMIIVGLAEVYRGTPAPRQNLDPYWGAEEEARKMGRGIWALGKKYVSPREWRRSTGK